MGKTLADVDLQVRQLVGDFQRVNFTEEQVTEAINWAQDAVMRIKGFKLASRLYDLSAYPTGVLPSDWLVIKRVQLVQSALALPYYTITVTPSALDFPWGMLRTFQVNINRYNGYSNAIDISFPFITNIGWDGTGGFIDSPMAASIPAAGLYVAEAQISSLEVYPHMFPVLMGAPDLFTLSFQSTAQAQSLDAMANGVTLIGDYDTLNRVFSNTFTLTHV